jgi:glutaredoxin
MADRLPFRFVALLLLWLAAVGVVFAPQPVAAADEATITVHIFWQKGCPYCADAKAELAQILAERPGARLDPIELMTSDGDDALFGKVSAHFGIGQPAVPLVIVGERVFLGHADDGRSGRAYAAAIDGCLRAACLDVVAALRRGESPPRPPPFVEEESAAVFVPDTVELPFFGTVRTRDLSLPALTVVLAAVDGFNPCAMWVLVFLIGLLLGLENEKRMWWLGGAFLLATAAMYFAVMAAWLELVLAMGTAAWLRLVVGVVAVAAGGWFLWEFKANPDAACRVTDADQRARLMSRFRRVVAESHLLPATIGIMALAVAVNFIELVCSAGVPVVYGQILAMSDLTPAAHYAHLALYLTIFMFDDVAIFVTAMVALRVSGLTGAYARWSHLIGGIVLVALGATMIFRPEWLG